MRSVVAPDVVMLYTHRMPIGACNPNFVSVLDLQVRQQLRNFEPLFGGSFLISPFSFLCPCNFTVCALADRCLGSPSDLM